MAYVGSIYTIIWYDILDCSIQISRDNGDTWESIASNVITPLTEQVPLIGSYAWTVTGPVSATCLLKIIDNSDAEEFIGDPFSIELAPVEQTPTDFIGMPNFGASSPGTVLSDTNLGTGNTDNTLEDNLLSNIGGLPQDDTFGSSDGIRDTNFENKNSVKYLIDRALELATPITTFFYRIR